MGEDSEEHEIEVRQFEPTITIRFKQTARGFFYVEWAVKEEKDFESLKKKNEELRDYALKQLKKLNHETVEDETE